MLRELRIENLLLIERAELRLGPGLNAITGETGAGKTVLAHSLDLLMGGRARAADRPAGRRRRPGSRGSSTCPRACSRTPELAEIAERLPEGAEEIVLGRRVSASGRTGAFVAGRAASAADLKLLGGRLLAFYGQHEHRKLTISSAQLEILDGFAGADHLETRRRYRDAYRETAATRAPRWRSCAGATAPASGTSTCCASSWPRSRRPRPTRPRRRGWRASGSACATPRACAAPTRLRSPAIGGRGDRGRGRDHGARRGPWPRSRPSRAWTPSSTRSLRASAASPSSSSDAAAELRAYADGLDADPARLAAVEERLDADRPARAQARRVGGGGARPRRALPQRDRAARARG